MEDAVEKIYDSNYLFDFISMYHGSLEKPGVLGLHWAKVQVMWNGNLRGPQRSEIDAKWFDWRVARNARTGPVPFRKEIPWGCWCGTQAIDPCLIHVKLVPRRATMPLLQANICRIVYLTC